VALACFHAALAADNTKPDIHHNLSIILTRRKEYEKSLYHARKALDLGLSYPQRALNNIGYVLEKLDRPDEAMARYRESIRIDPNQPQVYRRLAAMLADRGRFAEAVKVLDDGMASVPSDVPVRRELAMLLATAPDGKVRDGARALRLATQLAQEAGKAQTPALLDVLAAAYAETGDFSKAAEVMTEAVFLAESAGRHALSDEFAARRRMYLDHKPLRRAAKAADGE
jgi:Flp pilus assembly protein TadD